MDESSLCEKDLKCALKYGINKSSVLYLYLKSIYRFWGEHL